MAEAQYRDFLGLTHNPFASPRKGFFSGGDRKQLLEQLRHLNHWSERVLLVTGPRGSGKTSLYRALADGLEDRATPARVQGALTNSAREVLVAIAHSYGLDHPLDANAAILRDLVRRYVAEQAETERFCVILVDDAHLLEPKALEQLLGLQSEAHARVVLFGDGRIVGAVTDAARRLNLHWHEAKLRALTAQEVREFVQWRIAQGEGKGVGPFTETEVSEIVRHSEGKPVVIDTLGEEMLNRKASGEPAPRVSRFPTTHRILVGGLLAVFALLYLVVQRLEQPAETVSSARIELPDRAAESPARSAAGQRQVDAKAPSTRAAAATPADAGRQTGRGIDADQTLPSAERQTQPEQLAATRPAAEQDSEAVVESGPQTAATAAPSPVAPAESGSDEEVAPVEAAAPRPVPVAERSSAPADTAGVSGARSASWLLAQPASSYTIQLLTLSSEDRLQDFLQRQNQPGEFATYRLARDGRVYHVVVYGMYQDRAAADQAARRLPGTVGQLKPWIRPLGQVHEAIESTLQR